MSDVHGYRAGRRTDTDLLQRLSAKEGATHTSDSAIVWSGRAPYKQTFHVSLTDGVLRMSVDDHEQRRLYWRLLSDEGGIEFASRIDLLARRTDTVNLEALSCQWSLFTSVSKGTLFNQIHRVPSNTVLRFDGESISFDTHTPTAPPEDPTSVLFDVLRSSDRSNVVLGLSGGFDSRTLMAALHGAGVAFSVHTYGTVHMPDVQRARDMGRLDGVPTRVSELDTEQWDLDSILTSIKDTAWQTEGTYPGIHALVFDNAEERLGLDAVLVDGAYGALLRGGFGNGLLAGSFSALSNRRAVEVAAAMRVRDLELLRGDIRRDADTLIHDALHAALNAMPDLRRDNARNWIDEFFVRWYTRGFAASPQAVYDARLDSLMPFLDASVVRSVFAQPSHFRSNGRWFRHMISSNRPALRSLPMVGKKCDVPWICAGRPILTALWSKFVPNYPASTAGTIERVFYPMLRPVILDLVRSSPHTLADVWDANAIERLAIKTTEEDGSDSDRTSLLLWLGYRMMAEDLARSTA